MEAAQSAGARTVDEGGVAAMAEVGSMEEAWTVQAMVAAAKAEGIREEVWMVEL